MDLVALNLKVDYCFKQTWRFGPLQDECCGRISFTLANISDVTECSAIIKKK